MLRRLGIRGKVLAALSVPVLVLFVLAGAVSLDSVRQAQTARTMGSLLAAVDESREIVLALQAERRAALQYVGDPSMDSADMDAARQITTEAVEAFDRAVRKVDLATLDPSVAEAVDTLHTDLETLQNVRPRASARSVGLRPVLDDYTLVVGNAVAFPRRVADGLSDRRLAAVVSAHTEVTALVENYREEQTLGAQVLSAAVRDEDLVIYLGTLFPVTDLQRAEAMEAVALLGIEDVAVPLVGASFRDGQSYGTFRNMVTTREAQSLDLVPVTEWVERSGDEIDALEQVQTDLRRAAVDRANEVAGTSLRTAVLTVAIALAAVVLSIVTALAIARQIVNPLRRLTAAAGTVRDELPRLVDQMAVPGQEPDLRLTTIPVTSRDEVGQLATAFNQVNATTIDVAREQAALRGSIAEMFVNVARRDQVLLNRQLSFIDALERSEEDPKTLADLFRLDHLATRMRRNAESLLVLAGIDTGRRLREAIPTSDVIRTASSEIEHYERIQLDLPVDPMMLGHTALPAAHMLAELLENATLFSDPGTPVHVSTGIDEDDVLITVLDQGLGMTPEEIEQANTRIAATSASDVLGSQRLGLYVVGRIAGRLGARVELARGPGDKGTLVTVRMPLVLFVDATSIPSTPPATAPHVETFALPEEVAGAVQDDAPVPAQAQDVAPGSLGSPENPAVPVDLEALTDGTTPLGLPRRRSVGADTAAPAPSTYDRAADDAAAASSIPLAPRADALAGAARTQDEAWAPPVIAPSAPLAVRRSGAEQPAATAATTDEGPAGLPSREPTSALPVREEPSGTALPTRQPTAPAPAAAATSGTDAAAPATSTPDAPEGRAAMFSGFRSRRAELAAAAVRVESDDEQAPAGQGPDVTVDGAERLAAAAAFFGRSAAGADAEPAEATEPPLVVPMLVEDEDEFGDPVFVPGAPAVVVGEPATTDVPVSAAGSVEAPAEPESEPAGDVEPEQDYVPYFGRHAYVPEDLTEESWSPRSEPVPAVEEPVALADEPTALAEAPADPAGPVVPAAFEVPWPPALPVPGETDPARTEPAEASSSAESGPLGAGAGADAGQPWEQPAVPTWAPPTEPAWEPAAAHGAPAAPELATDVQPDRAPKRAKRRGWFGRRRRAEQVAAPAPAAFTPEVVTPAEELAPLTPVRQSVWDTPEGSHAMPAEETALEQTQVAPASFAPAPFAPAPFGPGASDVAPAVPTEPAPWQPAPAAVVGEPVPTAPEPQGVADVPTPHVQAPADPPSSAPTPAWAPQAAWEPPPLGDVAVPESAAEWAPTPAWGASAPSAPMPQREASVPAPHAEPSPLPARTFTPQTTFTPEPSGDSEDDQVTNALAQNADIAQQALAELSQLSSYRPKTVSASNPSTLQRRTPGTIPAAPEIERAKTGPRVDRDADQVRSLLSSFQSGTSRGRRAAGPADDGAADSHPHSPGEVPHPAGHEDGPDNHGEPVGTPGTDLNSRSTSW